MPDESSAMIPILHEEAHFWLVNKPAGLFSQAAQGVASLEVQLAWQIKTRDAHPGQPFVGLPHRLDRGTSGVMLIARNRRALKRFGQQFQSRKIAKYYLATVQGNAPGGLQVWEDFVRKIPDQAKAEIVAAESEGGRRAVATSVCVAQGGGCSLLLVQLETGRMHQIRVQAAVRGLPVVGDAAYGAQMAFAASDTEMQEHSHPPVALHALRLEFHHPQTAKAMSGTADLPSSWEQLPAPIVLAATELVRRSQHQVAQVWQLATFDSA